MNADGDDEFQAAAHVTCTLLAAAILCGFNASRTAVQTRSLYDFFSIGRYCSSRKLETRDNSAVEA